MEEESKRNEDSGMMFSPMDNDRLWFAKGTDEEFEETLAKLEKAFGGHPIIDKDWLRSERKDARSRPDTMAYITKQDCKRIALTGCIV